MREGNERDDLGQIEMNSLTTLEFVLYPHDQRKSLT